MADSKIIITGAAFPPLPTEFLTGLIVPVFPSFNEMLYLVPKERGKIVKAERARGYEEAIRLAKFFNRKLKTVKNSKARNMRDAFRDVWETPLTDKKIFTFVKVFRKQSEKDPLTGDRERDVYNVAVKAFIDGFTDAGVWKDDNEKYHTDLWIHFSGFILGNAYAEIYFYET